MEKTFKIKNFDVINTFNKFCDENINDTDFQLYPDIEDNDLVCSFLPGDKKRKYLNKTAVTLKHPIVEEFMAQLKNLTKLKANKPELCMYIYVLQNIFNDNNKSLYKLIIESDFDPQFNIFCKDIAIPIINHNFDDFMDFFNAVITMPEDKTAKKVKEIEEKLRTNNAFNTILIKDLFYIKNDDMNIITPSIIPKILDYEDTDIINNLYGFLKNKGLLEETSSIKSKQKHISKKLNELNTTLCTIVKYDDPFIESDLFTDYTLDKIDQFININNGYCFTFDFIAQFVINYKGNVTYQNLALKYKPEQLSEDLANYYNNNKPLQKDFIPYFDSYTAFEINILEEKVPNFKSTPLSKDKLKDLFLYLLTGKFKEKVKLINVKNIFDNSYNTIFDLIGLTGYILFSDMLTQMDNEDGHHFQISTYCLGQLSDFLDKTSLEKSLKDYNIEIGSQQYNIYKILGMAKDTCIHGIGKLLLTYYLRAYEDSLLLVNNENYDINLFTLAPYIVKVPFDIERSSGFRYLICLAYDDDVYSKINPNNHSLLISGFKKDNLHFHHLFNINSKNYICNESMEQTIENLFIISYIDYGFQAHVRYYEDNGNQLLIDYYRDNRKELIKLLKIPYTFHKHRKATYKVFKEYTYNLCKLLNEFNPSPTSKSIRDFSKKHKIMDYISFDEFSILPKFLTIIDLKNNSDKQMWNTNFNATGIADDSNYYIDSFENFLKLEYNRDDDGKPIIQTPATRKDITRTYHYGKLIGKIICNNNFNNIEIKLSELYSYFSNYFRNVAGQDTELRNGLFKNLSYQLSDGRIVTKGTINDGNIIIKFINEVDLLNVDDLSKKYLNMNNTDFNNFYKKHINTRLSFIKNMYTAFYKIAPPNINNYYNDIADFLKDESDINNVIYNLIYLVCSEGMNTVGFSYHFTEIDKEFYLIKYIEKRYRYIMPNVDIKDDICIETMIRILNDIFPYFKEDEDVALKLKGIEYMQDSKKLAIEYLTKIELINMHAMRMYVFWDFEKMIIKLLDSDTYDKNRTMFLNIANYLRKPTIKNLDDFNKILKDVKEKRQLNYIFEQLQSIITTV